MEDVQRDAECSYLQGERWFLGGCLGMYVVAYSICGVMCREQGLSVHVVYYVGNVACEKGIV